MASDGSSIYYDPVYVLQMYQTQPTLVTRTYLHILLHCIFSHNFQYDKLDKELWDMASDIAVENVIAEMKLSGAALETDDAAAAKLKILKEDAGALTAERIYRLFRNSPPSEREKEQYVRLFKRDVHTLWTPAGQLEVSVEQWKKISERIKADLKSFTKAKAGAEVLEKNLEETTRDKYDYGEILRRFTVMGEDIRVNDDEFDYIYYTYGLQNYGNLPLIEPLEYKESNKVREFVIAIDTSASCRGAIVRAFLQKTYSILKSSENFFTKINVHIIQCDSEVQSDTRITCDEDFDKFIKYGKLNGFGSTDFRPVFDYVNSLKQEGEFEKLKGLIYFTDGYGIYPERMPDYDVIFAFLDEDENRAPVPPWSMKVVLDSEEFIENEH
jgi:predicted metal-dependent peptidase